MRKDDWDNYEPVADTKGELRDFPAGSFREDGEISEVGEDFPKDVEPPKPYFDETVDKMKKSKIYRLPVIDKKELVGLV